MPKTIGSAVVSSVDVATPDDLEPIVARVSVIETTCATQGRRVDGLTTLCQQLIQDASSTKTALEQLTARVLALETPPPPQPPPPPPPPPATTRETLKADDFTLLGSYAVDPLIGYMFQSTPKRNGGELNYGHGFTYRYVNGKLRFLTLGYISNTFRLVEFELPDAFGNISKATNVWELDGKITNGWWHGIWWDDDAGRLWLVQGVDYPGSESNKLAIYTLKLNDDGTVSSRRGPWGLKDIPDRRIMGGVCKIPQWFQSQNSVGRYGLGFGGYSSKMMFDTVSLGLSLYAISDPETMADNQLFNSFATLSDHSSATGDVTWYANGKPTNFDRGIRSLPVDEQYDKWKCPAPDGFGRWTWGDTAANTGCWIDNDTGARTKHGFVIVPTFATGKAWYQSSSLNFDAKGAEIQVFNPAHLAEASKGQRQPWAVQPVASKNITGDIVGHTAGGWGYLRPGGVEGASFDPLTNRLYVYCTNATSPLKWSHIYVYQVGGN